MSRIVAAHGDEHCKRREYASENDRGQNGAGRPDNVGRKLERRHAGIVHRRDTGADDRTADRNDDRRALDSATQRPMATMHTAKSSDKSVTGMLYPALPPGP
jgi:hypothetical protein